MPAAAGGRCDPETVLAARTKFGLNVWLWLSLPRQYRCKMRPHLLGAFLSGIHIRSAYAFYTTFIGAGHD